MLHRLALAILCLPLVLLTACPETREEGIIVNLQTDYVPTLEFDQIRVEVDGSTRREVAVSTYESFARPRFVTTYSAAPRGQRTITLALLRDAREVARRTLEIPFTGNYLATVVITRSCAGVPCGVRESCLGGRCVPNTCVTGTELLCGTPLCTTDTTCSSTTTCSEGACIGGACLEVPREGACMRGEACVPGTGCVSLTMPDAPIDAFSAPVDAFTPPPSFVLHRLIEAADAWTIVTPTGDFPSEPVEAAFTAGDGSLRVLTRTEVFTMSATGAFSGRMPRDTLFPELSGMLLEAADRMGNTLTMFHNAYTTYTWREIAPPVFVSTTPYAELPAAWRGPLAPSTFTVHAFYSAPHNAQGWAVPQTSASCGVSGAYSELLSFTGFGPSALQATVYSFDCSEFVARRDYGSASPFTFPETPSMRTGDVEAMSYADGLWVFTR